MPTPFTHLEIAQRLLCDAEIPDAFRALLNAERGAFLLGNIAADARVSSGITREATHFYAYDRPIEEHPWRVMVEKHPTLQQPHSRAQAAFVAGYVAHLSIDEAWGVELVRPRFVKHDWGEAGYEMRFLMLHVILTYMDERDLPKLESWQAEVLPTAAPDRWLPFMGDDILRQWRDYVAQQIAPGGKSLTLQVLGERIMKPPEELRAILDSPSQMEANLWRNVPRDFLVEAERKMYTHARQQVYRYLTDYTDS
jgi:hypothetical protein